MVDDTLDFKPLPALRLAQVGTEVNEIPEIAAVTHELFETLTARLASAGHTVTGRGVWTYYGRPDGSKIDVAVGMPMDAAAGAVEGLELVELPTEEPAAAVTHRGPAHGISDAWYLFEVALDQRGLESHAVNRQVFIDAPDSASEWVIELQCPVRARGSACAKLKR